MSFTITMNTGWEKKIEDSITKDGLLDMVTAIDSRAKALAPKDTRALVDSSRIAPIPGGFRLSFGSSRVPYAYIQHEGGIIRPKNGPRLVWRSKDGNWHSARSVTIKGTHYLSRAADSVFRGDISKYFRGKI